jgi:hypothetical protein
VLAKDVNNYGGVFVDAEAVGDPSSEIAARIDNRIHEDVAQMTRVTGRVRVKFTTSAAVAPVSITPHTDGRTVWGAGASFDPTISKTATGVYLITFATTYDDALVGTTSNSVSETETVNFTFCSWNLEGSVFGHVQVTPLNNTLTARVFDAAGALTDLAGAGIVHIEAA